MYEYYLVYVLAYVNIYKYSYIYTHKFPLVNMRTNSYLSI